MGLHQPLHPAPSSSRPLSPPVGGHRAADLQRALQLGALLLTAWLLAFLMRPMAVTVDGQRRLLPRRVTVARAAELAGVAMEPGDLVDVCGLTLRAGGGVPPRFTRNGEAVTPDQHLRRGDVLTLAPGRHVMEPCREQVRLRRGWAPGFLAAGVAGTERVRTGLTSGHLSVETTRVAATVPLAAATHRQIALTFDDGPWPDSTAAILSALEKHGARGTFFVLGNLARYRPELIRRMAARGSEVAIHSWTHTDYRRLGNDALRLDLTRCASTLRPLSGQPVRHVRPPYGSTDRRIAGVITGAGFRQVLWSIDTHDWRRPGANLIAGRILSRAGDGAIVLCHDGGGPRSGTVAAIRRVVPELQRRGFELVTVTEILDRRRGPSGGALILADGRRLPITPSVSGLVVRVDGEVVVLADPPVEVDHHLVLPLKPVLNRLRVRYQWDPAAQKLVLVGAGERLTLRINSLQVEKASGETFTAVVPPILYRGRAMVPLPLILQAAGATASYDPQERVLSIISMAGLLQTRRMGWAEGRDWARRMSWTVQYGEPF